MQVLEYLKITRLQFEVEYSRYSAQPYTLHYKLAVYKLKTSTDHQLMLYNVNRLTCYI